MSKNSYFGMTVLGLLAAVLLLIASPAQAGAHKEVVPPPKIEIDPAIEADINTVSPRTAVRLNSQDLATPLELCEPH